MQSNRNLTLLMLTLAGTLALTACNNSQPPETAPPATESTPMAPAPETAPPATTPPAMTTPAQAPVAVTSVDLGSAVGDDQKVTSPTTTFSPKDTVYAAVSTSGNAPSATLTAKWSYQDGQTVNESSQNIAPNGPATTTFHISKPDGWPTGNYKVEISLNGTLAVTKDFTVQ
jgi:hypothetical protein